MKVFIIFIICATFWIVQAQEFIAGEVLAGIPHDYLTFPEGKNKALFEEISATPALEEIFLNYGVTEIERIFPNFQRADTLFPHEKGELVKNPDLSCIYKLIFSQEKSVYELVSELNQLYDVMYAEPNYICQLEAIPNDPRFSEQWNFNQENDCDVNAPEAWDIQTGNTAVKIGIFDSGIDWAHPDFGGEVGVGHKIAGGWNYIEDNSDILDVFHHGTHVAGIAGALTNNQYENEYYGVAGIAGGWGGNSNYGCAFYSFLVINEYGTGEQSDVARAIQEAAFPIPQGWGINVMNLSIGFRSNYNITLRIAITVAHNFNRIIVASKGNDNTGNLIYPSDYGNGGRGNLTISVGATDENDERWYDPVTHKGSNYGNNIDVVAPGENVLSTMPTYITRNMRDNNLPTYFHRLTGTSMAAPHVTGLAGIILSQNQSLASEDIEGIVQKSAVDKGSPGYDEYYGYGRGDAFRALSYLFEPWELFNLSENGGEITTVSEQYDMMFPTEVMDQHQRGWKVKKYKIQRAVNFPYPLYDCWVWGKSDETHGWSQGDQVSGYGPYQYEENWCDTVGGTLTSTGVTLQTYVYEVWKRFDEQHGGLVYVGWRPCSPQNVKFNFAVLGRRPINVPSNVTGTPLTDNIIKISWHDNSTNEGGFKVDIKGGQYPDWTYIRTVNKNVNSNRN